MSDSKNTSGLTPLPADLGRRWRESFPEIGRGPVPIEPMISRRWFEWERDGIFKRCWLNVGTVDEIPNPGDYIVREIHAAGASIIVVRARDGEVRAFHNVCRHRGNKLVWDFKGISRGTLGGAGSTALPMMARANSPSSRKRHHIGILYHYPTGGAPPYSG